MTAPKIKLKQTTSQEAPRVERESETREATARKRPNRRPNGDDVRLKDRSYKLGWIRKSIRGRDDPDNVIARRQGGWEPVRPDELANNPYEGLEDVGMPGVIQRKDTILMKIPEEFVAERAEELAEKADLLQEAVDGDYDRVTNPRYISIERSGTKPVRVDRGQNAAQFEDSEGGNFAPVRK